MKTYEEFREALAQRESSGRYDIKNPYGYVGRYQFSLARLTDLGLCRRIPGTVGFSNASFEWLPPHDEEEFLTSPALQDEIFRRHVDDLRRQLHKFESGLVAGAHLLGPGGVKELLLEGKVGEDALGTKITSYIAKFSGYALD